VKPSVGDRLDLEISKVVHGGFGLARHDGFVIFVKGVLPGETVTAELYQVKKSHGYAHLMDVSSASPHRKAHVWPEADHSRPIHSRVGGADYGHIERDYQRELKRLILEDSLIRFGRVGEDLAGSVSVGALPADDSGLHWRTRTILHVSPDGTVGPYAEETHTVVPVTSLPLSTPESEALGVLSGDFSGHRRIRIVHPTRSEPRLIIDEQKAEPITEWVGEIPFHLSDQSFWQVHRSAATTLFDSVASAVTQIPVDPDATHWDLYGGVGLLARALLESLGKDATVVSVESDKEASRFAASNLAQFPRARAVASSTEEFLTHHDGSHDLGPLGVVVLDPPRSGAKEAVVQRIRERAPQAVVYVACDPVALGRDLGLFRERGYTPTEITGLDLFPHTHHFETIAVLHKEMG
jgi:tRNA/tmRNA/rRNA uracil-C5-methylase (TrmA/RlmC/RlmD family)